MNFRAVGNRCAVHFASLALPIADDVALGMLKEMGYRRIELDLVSLARGQVGRSKYRRGARKREAPEIFDCSSFTRWLYGECGIWLPRYSIQQYEACHYLPSGPVRAGDLAFSEGFHSWYRTHPTSGIGHVGIVTDERTVIHAANSEVGVIEEPLELWQGRKGFRGVRRFIPSDVKLVIFTCPIEAEVESSDDIRWKILQRLPR